MRSVVPNDALFMHGTVVAFPFFAAARSAKKRVAIACERVNGLGVGDCVAFCCTATVAEPSERTTIVKPLVFVDPESTIFALSVDTAPSIATAMQPSANARPHCLKSTEIIRRTPTGGTIPSNPGVADVVDAGGTRNAYIGIDIIPKRYTVRVPGVMLPDTLGTGLCCRVTGKRKNG